MSEEKPEEQTDKLQNPKEFPKGEKRHKELLTDLFEPGASDPETPEDAGAWDDLISEIESVDPTKIPDLPEETWRKILKEEKKGNPNDPPSPKSPDKGK